MKHRSARDFFYDINDIMLAFAIIVVAALLIWWRMSVIMNYPQTLAEETDTTQTTTEEATTSDSSSSDKTDESDTTKDTATDTSKATFTDGKLTADVKVTVQGGSATGAVQSLIDAGLFASYDEFTSVCSTAGCTAENIKAATFTFAVGSTQADIALKVTR